MDGVLEVERRGQRLDVFGVGVHFVAGVGLGRTAVATAVVGDDAKTVIEEEQHLIVPVIGAERPAVMENDRLALAPILVENLNTVLGGDRTHD